MRRVWIFLFIVCLNFALLATEECEDISQLPIQLSAECEPLTTVAGCVNISSGAFFQVQQDTISNTIEPINLIRHYDSLSPYESFIGLSFGSQFPLIASDTQQGSRHTYAMISEREGFYLPYQGHFNAPLNHAHFKIDPRLLEKGYTNLNRLETNGGCANFVNWRASFHASRQQKAWTVQLGDGTQRTYCLEVTLSNPVRKLLNLQTKTAYLLTEEIKPNGNRLQFSYKFYHGKPLLSSIKTLNRSGTAVLNTLLVEHQKGKAIATTSCGRQASYQHRSQVLLFRTEEVKEKRRLLKSVESTLNGTTLIRTQAEEQDRLPLIVEVSKPNGPTLQISYDKEHKVRSLKEKIGSNGEMVTTYRFQYGKDDTKVWNAEKELTIYRFDKQRRLSRIDTFNHNTIEKQEVFDWSPIDGQEGWLRSKAVVLGPTCYHLKTYQYDKQGNVICQTLFGNLTGEKSQTFKSKSETDSYSIFHTYSTDGRNLLLKKWTPEGLAIEYSYLPSTNLCTKKLTSYEGSIQERRFIAYDLNGQVQTIIEDDGSSPLEQDLTHVTFRRITTIAAEQTEGLASYGKPKQIIEAYLDLSTGEIIPLTRTELSYDSQGNEIAKKVYDSSGNLYHESLRVYDERSRLVQEKDKQGCLTTFSYDENNNKTKEVRAGKTVVYEYDGKNRLISKTEIHQITDENPVEDKFTTTYQYNSLNQLVSETDRYGHVTSYQYDRLGRQTAIINPKTNDVSPIIQKTYDLLGHLTSVTDERGYTTSYTHTVRGDVTSITYPDGSIERAVYTPAGKLKQKWQADGTSICYTYNAAGRPTLIQILGPDGQVLKQETYTYKGKLLLSKTDHMGLVTTYTYDGAGRKSGEITGSKAIGYAYDGLDRVVRTFYALNEQEGRLECLEYNGADQVISKTWQDLKGQIFRKETYAYDSWGHQIEKCIWQDAGTKRVFRSCYSLNGKLVWQEDPLGYRTHYTYNHTHVNGLGQTVQCRALYDKLGRPTLEADDIYSRVVKQDTYEGQKQMSSLQFEYDLAGHLVCQRSSVMAEGQRLREYAIERVYNSRGWLTQETELPVGKTTTYTYDSMGRLLQKQKNDGVCLCYTYDSLGRRSSLISTDGTVHYQYKYDGHDNLIEIHDAIFGITQRRVFDLNNRLIKEELEPGSLIQYTYDSFDRITQMTLPDGSFVRYTYNSFHLKKAERFNAQGVLQYSYTCQSYNWEGQLLKGISPAGATYTTYDGMGRTATIKSQGFEKNTIEFDKAGNLLVCSQKDPSGLTDGQFSYDHFDHLQQESFLQKNQYQYDSLGNCLKKNDQVFSINELNQITTDSQSEYFYDANGNLVGQTRPDIKYQYDALNRLVKLADGRDVTVFVYDSFGRCLQIKNKTGVRHLLYQDEREIGSLVQGQLDDFRLFHSKEKSEKVLSLELQGEAYFPVQDSHFNVCLLQKSDGTPVQWTRYTAFGQKQNFGEVVYNPWQFANHRDVHGLILFTHRLYNPNLMRWMTTDPIGFEDSLNMYQYNHNNPFRYYDSDGQYAFAIPIFSFTFGAVLGPIVVPTLTVIAAATATYALYQGCCYVSQRMDYADYDTMYQVETPEVEVFEEEQTTVDNSKGKSRPPKQPVRTEPKNLEEQLALEEAKFNPIHPDYEIMKGKINDPRYPSHTWKKADHVHEKPDGKNIDIHFWENRLTGEREGFKFKNP